MQVTPEVLSRIVGKPINDNMRSVCAGLDAFGRSAGLDKPHRLAHYLAQLIHESGAFRYDKEVWGPTPAQARYDTRTDLGNTPQRDGDGEKFKGRGPIQITGRANTAAFRDWCRANGMSPPDFEKDPDLINTDPWEGLGPIWYWQTRKLNQYADANDIEMVTRRINGGVNGLADRIEWYTKTALVLAGFSPGAVKSFQIDAQKRGLLPEGEDQIDGVAGPKTRAALHMTLAAATAKSSTAPVKPSPVTEEVETEVAVTPANAEKTGTVRAGGLLGILSPILAWLGSSFVGLNQTGVFILIGLGVLGTVILLWRGELIAARARAVLAEFQK